MADPKSGQERKWQQNTSDWNADDAENNGFEEVETGRFSVYEFVDDALSEFGRALETIIMGEPID